MKELTLSYLMTDTKICLGYKKRGFGEGLWNGYGGKVESGETIPEAAVREIQEESEVMATQSDLEKVALVDFHFVDGAHLHVHTYFTRAWEGEPRETSEMRPAWFLHNEIPYNKMWSDDKHWLPRALAGEKLRGEVWFDETDRAIKDMKWLVVDSF